MIKIYFTLVGTILSSFFCVVAERTISHQNFVFARSRCSSCKSNLRWFNLIPVVSFLLQRGRCMYCDCPIPLYLIYYEMIGGFIFFHVNFHSIPLIIFLTILEIISIFDLLSFHFPLIASLTLFGLAFLLSSNVTTAGIIILVYLSLLYINHRFELIGNGDLDVFCALAIAFGIPQFNLMLLLASSSAMIYMFFSHRKMIPFTAFLFPFAVFICFV